MHIWAACAAAASAAAAEEPAAPLLEPQDGQPAFERADGGQGRSGALGHQLGGGFQAPGDAVRGRLGGQAEDAALLGLGASRFASAGATAGLFRLMGDGPVLRLGQGIELVAGRADHEIAKGVVLEIRPVDVLAVRVDGAAERWLGLSEQARRFAKWIVCRGQAAARCGWLTYA